MMIFSPPFRINLRFFTPSDMSSPQGKKKKLTEFEIMRLCIKYYLSDIKNIKKLFLVLVASIAAKHVIAHFAKKLKYGLINSENLYADCQLMFIFHIAYSISSSSAHYIILCCSTFFQTNISTRALSKILKYESATRIDLASGKTQYAISEGSLAMSKLFEHCIIELFQKFGYLLSDFVMIWTKTSPFHFTVSLGVSAVAIYIHIRGALIAMGCKKGMNEARGLCDKSVYEDITNYEIIKSFQTEDKHLKIYKEKLEPWKRSSIAHAKTIVTLSLLDDILFLGTAFMFTIILRSQGVTDPSIYRNVYDLIDSLEKTMENVSSIFRKYKESLITSRMILYYLEDIDGFVPGTSVKNTFDDKIVFRDVSYSINEVNIFRNINFTLNKGDKACIFGRNGSGKSTISRILMRLCFIDAGSVTIDDMDIYQVLITKYRQLITYVPQETNLFDDTVFANLAYGNDQPFSAIVEECKKMDIHDDIIKLENGYNTYLGERGSSINGGLRQKLFYVRALLTKAPIYIFDEPTNNLDEASAHNVIDLILGDKFADKTVLVICHDYEMVKRFPKVLKFTDGKIIEEINN